MAQDPRVKLGRITTVYGVKGWVKVFSNTEPMDNIFAYQPWQIFINGQWQEVKLKQGKRHGKGLVAQLEGCNDRDQAKLYAGAEIAVESSKLPDLEDGDYYWSQLTGMNVETEAGVKLGKVDHLIATGSNDVLVVKGNQESIDTEERLIPWLPDQVITKIDLSGGVIRVDWDPEF
ncbi:MAG: ribosome maturation factor RimM [Gammaproteobacteria bacterium]|jgi:16S rRNA processing protein RimM|nr:ribosome maturation factor RimM [Gammaproteobacteria bacterium]MCP4879730.1 ribosome maturation factor RimM [Gammaproteobacteria bacterium]MDP6164968.1 ribosome maturation factor RimM [Gammaproteobacteria bacterium]